MQCLKCTSSLGGPLGGPVLIQVLRQFQPHVSKGMYLQREILTSIRAQQPAPSLNLWTEWPIPIQQAMDHMQDICILKFYVAICLHLYLLMCIFLPFARAASSTKKPAAISNWGLPRFPITRRTPYQRSVCVCSPNLGGKGFQGY